MLNHRLRKKPNRFNDFGSMLFLVYHLNCVGKTYDANHCLSISDQSDCCCTLYYKWLIEFKDISYADFLIFDSLSSYHFLLSLFTGSIFGPLHSEGINFKFDFQLMLCSTKFICRMFWMMFFCNKQSVIINYQFLRGLLLLLIENFWHFGNWLYSAISSGSLLLSPIQ